MKVVLFNTWHIMRWVRLGFAFFLFYQAVVLQEWMFLVFGLFFFIQAVFNLGCGFNGCAISNIKK